MEAEHNIDDFDSCDEHDGGITESVLNDDEDMCRDSSRTDTQPMTKTGNDLNDVPGPQNIVVTRGKL